MQEVVMPLETPLAHPLQTPILAVKVAALGDESDSNLLARFAKDHDDAAFTVLVKRHGPRVLRTCRGVLRHSQDAEDAFQATFLVLARRAQELGGRESLGNWLGGVAWRIAQHRAVLRARDHAAVRGGRGENMNDLADQHPSGTDDVLLRELDGVLRDEFDSLTSG
jgi:DNA-directed RNA polymerase specialized sigma24 family protein